MTPPNMNELGPISRLEIKVDALTTAVNRLVLFEERQAVQALAIIENTRFIDDMSNKISGRLEHVEKKLDMWINRGLGVWAFAIALFALYKAVGR